MSDEYEVENAMDQLIADGIGQQAVADPEDGGFDEPVDDSAYAPQEFDSPDAPDDHASADPVAAPRNRAEIRMQKLANERAEARAKAQIAQEQAEFYRKQLEQAQAYQRQPQPPVDEFVDPEEKWRRDVEARTNQALAAANDLNDRAAYNLRAAANPMYAKYADRVEAELNRIRSQGGNAPREEVLKYVVGQDALASQGKPTKSAQRAQAAAAAARGATPGMRSNVSQERAPSTAAERLKGVTL